MKKIYLMKNFIFKISLLTFFCSFSQGQTPKIPKYNAKNVVGLFYYNVNEAIEKVKLKKDETISSFTKSLRNYNSKIKDISFLNTPKLAEVDLTLNSIGEQAMTDIDLRNKARKIIETTVVPLRDSVLSLEKKLNTELEKILNKKQNKKWLRYQKNEKEKLLPKLPQSNQNNNNNQMMMRNRGFRNGIRY